MSRFHPYSLFPLGDSALLLDFGNGIDEETNRRVLGLFHALQRERLPFITNLVPGFNSLTVCYDVWMLEHLRTSERTAFDVLAEWLESFRTEEEEEPEGQPRIHRIPVCYAEAFAADLAEVARCTGLEPADIVRIHTERSYRVYMLGFLPGFAYLGAVDERIAVPRKAIPRRGLAQGSVGLAGGQTGIYPLDSPGGWQIIGRTPAPVFFPEGRNPVRFHPGDTVQFYPITEDEYTHYPQRPS